MSNKALADLRNYEFYNHRNMSVHEKRALNRLRRKQDREETSVQLSDELDHVYHRVDESLEEHEAWLVILNSSNCAFKESFH